VTVLHNPEREPASSRNLGARSSRASVLAFTDADCEPDPEWLAGGLRALATADIVQGKVLPADHVGPFDRSLAVTSEYGLYETANLLVRRSIFDRVGGFEPLPGLELPGATHFGEDVWFVWRAKRLGARTTFADDALVRHAVVRRTIRESLRELGRRRHFPYLLKLVPELRDAFLHRRLFLSPATMRFDAALLAMLLARRGWPAASLLALPEVQERAAEMRQHPPQGWSRLVTGRLAQDVVSFAALSWGSIASGTVVL
jgi:GT2 family glycosyltransferase